MVCLTSKRRYCINTTMTEKRHDIEDILTHTLFDTRVSIEKSGKTLEQMRQEFFEKWKYDLVDVHPLVREGESQKQLVEKGEVYQRPHAEIYDVEVNPTDK